jgi:hypothetical protein
MSIEPEVQHQVRVRQIDGQERGRLQNGWVRACPILLDPKPHELRQHLSQQPQGLPQARGRGDRTDAGCGSTGLQCLCGVERKCFCLKIAKNTKLRETRAQ